MRPEVISFTLAGLVTGLMIPPIIRLIRRKIAQSITKKAAIDETCANSSNGAQLLQPNSLNSNAFDSNRELSDQCGDIEVNVALFFPDETRSSRSIMAQHFSRSPINGMKVHEHSPFNELFSVLESVKRSLDVCMYIITYPQFAEFLIDASQLRNVAVRIVIDSRENEAFSTQLPRIRDAGIEVRRNPPSKTSLMHSKFVVIDNRILITGSLNWTRAAICENYDNVLITTHTELVSPYIAEFGKLWQSFAERADESGHSNVSN